MDKPRAELLINGPKGFASAEIEVRSDGKLEPWAIEAAAVHASNLYNDLPEPASTKDAG